MPHYLYEVRSSYEVMCQSYYLASNEIREMSGYDLILVDTQNLFLKTYHGMFFQFFFNLIRQVENVLGRPAPGACSGPVKLKKNIYVYIFKFLNK